MLINWLLIFSAFATTAALKISWALNDFSVSEKMTKTILESCYQNDTSFNPIVLLGDFNEFIDKSSIMRINNLLDVREHYGRKKSSRFKASRVVLREDSPEKLIRNLKLLRKSNLWNQMASFIVVGKNSESCRNSVIMLFIMWKMEILNSIYICSQSVNNTTELYTLNPIANYALHPWKRVAKVGNLNYFHQTFDPKIPCENLNYDKTKILDGYKINMVWFPKSPTGLKRRTDYFHRLSKSPVIDYRALRSIIIALKMKGRLEYEMSVSSMVDRIINGTADISVMPLTVPSLPSLPFLFPHTSGEMIAVVKVNPETSTLQKIFRLWSNFVLILSAIALAILFLVLLLKDHDFGFALLNIISLLIYTSIQTDDRRHSFRIYFTTMLIFMVISDGVFRGEIAAFLTTRDRDRAVRTVDELEKLGYTFYTPVQDINVAKEICPTCHIKEVSQTACMEYVLNSTSCVCIVHKLLYEAEYISSLMDHAPENFGEKLSNFKCRRDWPLHDRIDGMVMRLVESGLINFWNRERTYRPKQKREAMEAEWSSTEYRPVKLYKLMFSFHLLAIGLLFAIIGFFMELLWTKYGSN